MPAVLIEAFGALMSVGTHSIGTSSLPLDIIAGVFSASGIPISKIFYDSLKKTWRDQYLWDMKMGIINEQLSKEKRKTEVTTDR